MTDAEKQAERILDSMQLHRDLIFLKEMNGGRCASRQGRMIMSLTAVGYEKKRFTLPRKKKGGDAGRN